MRIPNHIGIIPDGNRRWAESKGLTKDKGYSLGGIAPGLLLFKLCQQAGIKEITYYGFTTDNTKRPSIQKAAFIKACIDSVKLLSKEDAELLVIGNTESKSFPKELLPYTTRRVFGKGGIIHTSSPVNKILFKDNKAYGVLVNGENRYSDIVVCSSDYSYTITNLIKDQSIQNIIKPINNLEYSCSTFILYLGLNKKYPNLNIHNIYINDNLKENIKATFNGYLPKNLSMYIYCPASIDDTMCPKNCEAINVMIRVPNTLSNQVKWTRKTINYLTKKTLKILSSINGLEDILDHIVYINSLTPLDFKSKYNTYGGAAFGLSHTLKQSVIFRPQCRIPSIKNLFFTGASIHPGNGVAMVLKSSKICAKEIHYTYKNYL